MQIILILRSIRTFAIKNLSSQVLLEMHDWVA